MSQQDPRETCKNILVSVSIDGNPATHHAAIVCTFGPEGWPLKGEGDAAVFAIAGDKDKHTVLDELEFQTMKAAKFAYRKALRERYGAFR
jgi:hypothetical protein